MGGTFGGGGIAGISGLLPQLPGTGLGGFQGFQPEGPPWGASIAGPPSDWPAIDPTFPERVVKDAARQTAKKTAEAILKDGNLEDGKKVKLRTRPRPFKEGEMLNKEAVKTGRENVPQYERPLTDLWRRVNDSLP